jgi:hypothetical protein
MRYKKAGKNAGLSTLVPQTGIGKILRTATGKAYTAIIKFGNKNWYTNFENSIGTIPGV